MLLPGVDGLLVVLRQIVTFALRERDGLHDGRVRTHELTGEVQIVEPLRIPFGIDADHTKTIGTASMLHAADEEGQLKILIGTFEAVELRAAHAGGIKRIESGVALFKQPVVQLTSCRKVAIHKPRISQRPVHQDIRRVPLTVFHSTDDTSLRLIGFGISKRQTSHHLSIHRKAAYKLLSPIHEGIIVALLLITVCQLAESIV